MMQGFWGYTALRLGGLALAGLVVGALYGRPLLGVLLATVLALGWQLLWLYRLDRWLAGEKMEFLPEGSGAWSRVFARADYLRQRARRRGKRFKALVKQLRQATRTFPDGGVILNARNEIVVFNEAARTLLGFKKKDRGLRVENLLRNPDFIEYLRAELRSAPVEIVSPLRADRWLSCNLIPYGLDQKMLLVRDITQQRKTEEMRREFVANASHELRTPLTVITGYLDAIAEDPSLVDELRPPVAEMQRQSLRMRELVDELLRLSELESDQSLVKGTAVNIRAIVETARQEALATPGCPAQLTTTFDSDADLRGSPKDIQSVVSNLVSNAVRYTPADGRIDIRWFASDKGAFLSVADTGKGISPDHIPRLCERFYRVEQGRERVGSDGGTGLGLAIVKHALLRHGATLKIESQPGKGSVFTCRFPASRLI